MVAHIPTVAFEGISVVDIDVQVQAAPGLPAFTIVGLPDKAVGESRERVRAALHALGLALPPKRIVVNLSPADLLKEGGHYDLPIALGLLAVIGVVPVDEVARYVALGELALDGSLANVSGVLPAAVHAAGREMGLICPAGQGGEAAWAGNGDVLAPNNLLQVINHFKGSQVLAQPLKPTLAAGCDRNALDLADVKGQESAKRALEIAAAGGHNLLMTGPPGAGKSMLAARLADLLPPLEASEVLEVSMIQSLAGELDGGQLTDKRPFRDPHHSASMAALVGGGHKAKPGEMSLAHLGVLFLDELPEFDRRALEALRQPLETGRVSVARANAHVTYPARVQLVGAMNPCRCGHFGDPARACTRAPKCAESYQSRLSGPLVDRFDLHIEVPPVPPVDLGIAPAGEASAAVAGRVAEARAAQRRRLVERDGAQNSARGNAGGNAGGNTGGNARNNIRDNASVPDALLAEIADPDPEGRRLLVEACERFHITARGYHRVLRVSRTIADLAGSATISRAHIAEALAYRRMEPLRDTSPLRAVG